MTILQTASLPPITTPPPPALSYTPCFPAVQLIHWKEPKKTGAAFGFSLLVLLSVATLSVISVVSYLLLTCLCVTITFRYALTWAVNDQ